MKRILRGALITTLLLTNYTLCLAKPTVSTSSIAGKFYIQQGEYLHESSAKHERDVLRTKTKYPIKIVHKQKHYILVIGPIASKAEMKKVAHYLFKAPAKHSVKPKNLTRAERLALARQEEREIAKQEAARAKRNKPVKSIKPAKPVKVAPVKQAPVLVKPKQTAMVKPEPVKPTPPPIVAVSSPGNWLVSVGAGVEFPSFKSNMKINNGSGFPAPFDQDIYTTKSRTQVITELNAGYRWAWDRGWVPAVSVMGSYQHLFSRNVGGEVIQYSSPAFTNYSYDWEVASDVVLALLKLNLFTVSNVSPYLAGGVGGAVNRISNYNEGPLPGATPRTNPAFQSTTRLKFAYRAGAGIDFKINPNVILAAEYQYQGIGTVSSKHGTGAWSGNLLNLGTYRANAVLLNVTYLIDN